MTISIVITAYRQARFLEAAVSSALGQTWPDKEIILVNGCQDGSAEPAIRRHKDRLTIIERPVSTPNNEFRAVLRNVGIRAARGGSFVFLDDDDMLHADMLRESQACMDAHSEAGLVYSSVEFVDSEGGFLGKADKVLRQAEGRIFEELLFENCIPVHSALVPRRVIEAVGAFDESLPAAADWDLWTRIASRHPVAHLPKVLAYYRIHDGSFHSNREAILQGNIALAEKHLSQASRLTLLATQRRILASAVSYNRAKLEFLRGRRAAGAFLLLKALVLCPRRIRSLLRLVKLVPSRP